MAEVLSQEEIDALLSALSSGDVEPETIDSVEEDIHKVKQYDFKTPQKFSKDHIRTLEKVHTKFARLISNYLTMQTRKSVKVNVENVEQVPYEEFIRSIPNPTIISYFKLHPMQGNIVMELNPEFGFQILDLLLGGFGVKRGIDKDLTEIEKNILSKVCREIIEQLESGWSEIMEVTPEFESLDTNPTANQTLAPNEPVALISFLVEYWLRSSDDEDEEDLVEIIKGTIQPVELKIKAELGKTQINVEEFLDLVVGDVLKLDTKTIEPIKVYVEDELCYSGKPGIIGKMAGVELLDTINKDVKTDE